LPKIRTILIFKIFFWNGSFFLGNTVQWLPTAVTMVLMTRVAIAFTNILRSHILRRASRQTNSVSNLRSISGLSLNFLHPEESKDYITNIVSRKMRMLKDIETMDHLIFLTSSHHYTLGNGVGARKRHNLVEERLTEAT
jgi:hypothetical protein